jgi:hypothetical protein
LDKDFLLKEVPPKNGTYVESISGGLTMINQWENMWNHALSKSKITYKNM